MSPPTALVVRTAGTNCDAELCRAFELAGAIPQRVHVDALVRDPERLEAYDLIAFPGGFSYGDDIASGRILAMHVREHLYPRLIDAIERGVPILGVCNGFQVLVQIGLLPGPEGGMPWPETSPKPQVALAHNASARFIDTWAAVKPGPHGATERCVWTRPYADLAGRPHAGDVLRLPIAHGEGRFVTDEATLASLETSGRVALRYGSDVNGSVGGVAGLTDATGLVFGLMPHPERYLSWAHHPYATRLDADIKRGVPPGLAMFISAVEHARTASATV
jgi:phosphoribosylformylglycinamidine synthase I